MDHTGYFCYLWNSFSVEFHRVLGSILHSDQNGDDLVQYIPPRTDPRNKLLLQDFEKFEKFEKFENRRAEKYEF